VTRPRANRRMVDRISEGARQWFLGHRGGDGRHRPPVVGECGPAAASGPRAEVPVVQRPPGMRVGVLVNHLPAVAP
jgi:hypothetical protein